MMTADLTRIAFFLLSVLVLVGAVATITQRNPLMAAVCLVGTLLSLAGIFALLQAHFLAAIQVIVYAGAIMVLFVFVIMLLDRPEMDTLGLLRSSGTKLLALFGVAALGWGLITTLWSVGEPGPVSDEYGTVKAIGTLLLRDYVLPFEAISLVLLVAIIGSVVLARSKT